MACKNPYRKAVLDVVDGFLLITASGEQGLHLEGVPLHRLNLLLVLLLERARHFALVHVPQDDSLVHAATCQDVPIDNETRILCLNLSKIRRLGHVSASARFQCRSSF